MRFLVDLLVQLKEMRYVCRLVKVEKVGVDLSIC